MRFDSSTFYSIIGVVPFRKKYLHSTSVLSSLSSFSNTSKVTIRGWLTQPSSPLKKNPSPPWSQAELLAWAKPSPASLLPASEGWGSGTENRASTEEKNTPSCWGSWDGEARQWMVLLGVGEWHRLPQGAKERQGCCPGMLPWDAAPPTPSSSFHGKGRPPSSMLGGRRGLVASAGEIWRNFEKFLWCETASFTESVSGSRQGRRKLENKNPWEREAPCQGCNALQDVELLISLEQC